MVSLNPSPLLGRKAVNRLTPARRSSTVAAPNVWVYPNATLCECTVIGPNPVSARLL